MNGALAALVATPHRLVRGVVTLARFVVAALRLFDEVIPRFRLKTAVVVVLELLGAIAAGISWTVLVPFLQHLTGGTTAAMPDDAFGRLYRFFGERMTLLTVAWVVFGAVVGKNVITLLSNAIHTRMAMEMGHRLRVRVFSAYIESDLKFFERAQDGRFINVFNQEVQRTEKILKVWRRAIASALTALVYLVLLFMISAWVTAVFLVGGVVLLVALMRFYYRLRETGYELTALMDRLNGKLAETIRCFVLMKSLGTEERERGHFERVSGAYARANFTQSIVFLVPGAAIETAAYALLLFVVTWIHARYVTAGTLNPFLVISYLIFANKLVDAATVVSGTLSQLLQDASGFDSTVSALAVRAVRDVRYGDRRMHACPPAIELEDVRFAHEGQVVLDRCSFTVGAGDLVAVVGSSGAGKSTLALIVAGLYHPDRGVVRIGGAPLTEHRRDELVRVIGYQPQEPRLVSGTVRDNLLYGLTETPGDVTIEAVLRRAHLEDLLERKDLELEATVGERGASLSGGERQRVAFARLLLRDPDVLVLDEITSALDPSTEQVLLDTLVALRGRKTIVFITHRLRSAAVADRILVLEAGHVVEDGTFDELLARNGAFVRLARRDRLDLEELAARGRGAISLDRPGSMFRN
jgi:ABC-type multidrug transport system fused ATPase/permease subunit